MRNGFAGHNLGPRMGRPPERQGQTCNAGSKTGQLGLWMVYYWLDIRVIPSSKKIKKIDK